MDSNQTPGRSLRKAPTVTLYSDENCPFCMAAKKALTDRGVPFVEMLFADGGVMMPKHPSAQPPQIFIDGDHIGGWDQLQELLRSGKI